MDGVFVGATLEGAALNDINVPRVVDLVNANRNVTVNTKSDAAHIILHGPCTREGQTLMVLVEKGSLILNVLRIGQTVIHDYHSKFKVLRSKKPLRELILSTLFRI
ncbi:hypothetical protein ACH5RR_003338 [Cinchona calisaya]|uniref:Uncharacterized protein n=1 Tax=Cinchona calisaya TaxID=153742 RepID=A0ABD3AUH3_9GENT